MIRDILKYIFILFFVFYTENIFADTVNLQRYVNDNANIISDSVEQALEQKLFDFNASTTNQIVMLTIQSLPKNETIQGYTNKVFNENTIGQKGKNNGLLFLISVDDKTNRFETGYGLEPILPDIYTGILQREIISPAFQLGDFDSGITQSIDKIIERIATNQPYKEVKNSDHSYFIPLFWFILFAIQILLQVFARSKSYWFGGFLGIAIGIIVFFITGIIWSFLLFFVGLFLDMFASKNPHMFKGGRDGHGPWGGFGGGSFGGFGSGGGGFSGGGGMSGGGGSTGRW